MRGDKKLQSDVIDELKWDPSVRDEEIAVAVQDGVVTIRGVVDTYAQKLAAARAVQRIAGVRALADEVEVNLTRHLQRTDTDLAHAIVETLRWDVEVPNEQITAHVEDGWVILEGKVDWQYEKEAAERAVRNLIGVKGLTNLLVVAPKTAASDVKASIEAALKRSAELDAKGIIVEAADGVVTLKGKVRSFAERRDAELAAWAAKGVTRVDDELDIALAP